MPKASKRVMYLVGRLNLGGVEISALPLFTDLSAQYQVEPVVYVISGKTGDLDDRFRMIGARIVYGQPGPLGLVAFLKHVLEQKPAIVHSNVSLASGFYVLIAWVAGVRMRIAQFHSTALPQRSALHRVQSALGRMLTNHFATRIVGVSEGTRALARAAPEKWQVIYNGVPSAPDVEISEFDPSLITVLGRITPEKNLERAIQVLLALRKISEKNWRLQFVGPGDPKDYKSLTATVVQAGLESAVDIVGPTSSPLNVLARSGMMLMTSRREGLPTVILEALSVGTPVVASALPGVLEIAGHVEGVTPVTLESSSEHWAREITRSASVSRESIAYSFASGPFGLARQVRCFAALWDLETRDARR